MALSCPERRAVPFVKPLIFHKNFTHWQCDDFGRNFQIGVFPFKLLCHPLVLFHRDLGLWKTPVEKPVENVENFDFSTAIFSPSPSPYPVQKFRQ